MLREARTPKVQTWLVNYVVNEERDLRLTWLADPDPQVASAGGSPGSTSPYAPVWIAEMVRRREG